MKLLITNDDGVNAEGIKKLYHAASKFFQDILVVAPMKEQSATSHKINIRSAYQFQKLNNNIYSVDSTPADCVKVASAYLNYDFDVVFSGINHGYNLGEDIVYSGTVAGAEEALLLNKKAIAFSCHEKEIANIDEKIQEVLEYVFSNKLLDKWSFWNINIPLGKIKGYKYTYNGNMHYDATFTSQDGFIKSHVKSNVLKEVNEKSDIFSIVNGYVSITPLSIEKTNFDLLEKLL